MKKVLVVVIALSSAGCLRTTTYKCTSNDMCSASAGNTGGTCEITGFCSFTDGQCAEGRRYGDLAGKFSGTCVGDLPVDIDAGVDGPPGDGPGPDVPLGNCPASYLAISGQTHRYRVISTQSAYAAQATDCGNDGTTTYLAIPDDQTELTAILTAATDDAWVGINDLANDGSFVTVKLAAFSSTSPLWAGGEPDDDPESGGGNNNGECVAGFANNQRLSDDRCDNAYVAVCECDP